MPTVTGSSFWSPIKAWTDLLVGVSCSFISLQDLCVWSSHTPHKLFMLQAGEALSSTVLLTSVSRISVQCRDVDQRWQLVSQPQLAFSWRYRRWGSIPILTSHSALVPLRVSRSNGQWTGMAQHADCRPLQSTHSTSLSVSLTMCLFMHFHFIPEFWDLPSLMAYPHWPSITGLSGTL